MEARQAPDGCGLPRQPGARTARLEGAPSGVLARVPAFTSTVPRAQSAAATGAQRPSWCTRGLGRDCKEERVRDRGAWVFRHLQAHADRAAADCKEERVDGENHRTIKGVTPEGVIAKRVLDRQGAPARLSWRACWSRDQQKICQGSCRWSCIACSCVLPTLECARRARSNNWLVRSRVADNWLPVSPCGTWSPWKR